MRCFIKSLAEKPLMSVLSKSKNAPICAPDSPAIISVVMLSVLEPGTNSRSKGTEGRSSNGFAKIMPCNWLMYCATASSCRINAAISFCFGSLSVGINFRFFTNNIPLSKKGLETASMRRMRPCQCISSPKNRQESMNFLSFHS